MEKQLAEYITKKMQGKTEPARPEKVLALLLGGTASGHQKEFLEKLHTIWGLERQDVLCQDFLEESSIAVDDAQEVAGELLRQTNRVMDEVTQRFSTMKGKNRTICAVVWASDSVAREATDLLNLAARWASLNDCGTCRLMLLVMLPRWNGVKVQQAINAFELLEKAEGKKVSPIVCPFYFDEDCKPEPMAWSTELETYFLECTDEGEADKRLEDAAYLLSPTAMKGGGLFLPGFKELTRVYKNQLAAQLIACIQQIEKKDGQAGVGLKFSITERIREYVENQEASEGDYQRWLQHACVFRSDPNIAALTREALYGTWLEELAAVWCDRLINRELPEQMLNNWIGECTDEQLALHKESLESFTMRTFGREGRSHDDYGGNWKTWQEFLEYELGHEFRDIYMSAVEMRINLLVQKMLTLVGAKLKTDTQKGTSQKELLEQLQRIENETFCDRDFGTRTMDDNQCIRFEQILRAVQGGNGKGREHLLDMAWELQYGQAEMMDEQQAECVPCCPHRCLSDVRGAYQELYQAHKGRRSGECLCVQCMNQTNSVKAIELTFFSQNRMRAGRGGK